MRYGYTILCDYHTPIGDRTMTVALRHYETSAIRDCVLESELEILARDHDRNSFRVSQWELPE